METNELTVSQDILSQKDRELILTQCEHQNATNPEQIEGFSKAYAKAKQLAKDQKWEELTPEQIGDLILDLAKLTESNVNQNGVRIVPVSFANGQTAIDPSNVSQALKSFCESFSEKRGTPVEFYKEFETIHPFLDGNGRVGDLLWKIAVTRETGNWPEELPPAVFGTNQAPQQYESAFGEIED